MLKNYLKIALRNLNKNKIYSFVNIIGLTIGLIAFILIGLYIRFELSFDTYHDKSDRMYNVMIEFPEGSFFGGAPLTNTPAPLANTLRDEIPEVETATIIDIVSTLFITGQQSFFEEGIGADHYFFNVFSYEWLAGDPGTALDEPNSIVLTKSLANKYFQGENPLGKTIDTKIWGRGDKQLKTVTGVIDDVPVNSHFRFDYVISIKSDIYFDRNFSTASGWTNYNYYTYFVVRPQSDIRNISDKITELLQNKLAAAPSYQNNPDRKLPDFRYMPLEDIHLYSSDVRYPIQTQNSIQTIYLFGLVAFVILLIACVNYMNLATARSIRRAKEVGIRKAAGAHRLNLVVQLISESVMIAFIAIIIALGVVQIAMPYFSSFIGYELPHELLYNGELLILLLGIGLVVGMASGSYPAFYMSGLNPVDVFKNSFRGSKSNLWLRNILVVGQFTVTVILMVSALVIYRQINFVQNKDTGLDREQVVVTRLRDSNVKDRLDAFKQELAQHSNIKQVSSSDHIPIQVTQRTSSVDWDGKGEGEYSFHGTRVNYDFLELFNFNLISGRTFSQLQDGDESHNYILNEQAVREIGWKPEEAIGKSFSIWSYEGTVVGVMEDFHFRSFHEKIKPIVFVLDPDRAANYLFAKIDTKETGKTLTYMESKFKDFFPEYPFDYYFLDDEYNRLYEAELRFGSIFNVFTILALVIACLGLFSLAAFMTEQRTKEIGIRKILGATVSRIIGLINKDFIKLVLVSFVIAVPISLYLLNSWLQNFAYRIEIGPGTYLLTGIGVIGIAILTVSFQSVKTALMNPVDSLRSE